MMNSRKLLVTFFVCIFSVSSAFAQQSSDTLTELVDFFEITEMYIFDCETNFFDKIDEAITSQFFMFRMQMVNDGSCYHSINVSGRNSIIAFAYGNQVECEKETLSERVLAHECYSGKMIASYIDDTTSLIFIYELLFRPDSNEELKEVVSFSYYFSKGALVAFGTKVSSNYDPMYMVAPPEKFRKKTHREPSIPLQEQGDAKTNE